MKQVSRFLSNLVGWSTKRKIVVIESDDWGSIRVPSLEIANHLNAKGLDMFSGDSGRYNTLDNLENEEDLDALFRTLSAYTDKNGKHPVFTAVSLVANPDFKKIKENQFEHYYYEPFTETSRRYFGSGNTLDIWKKGMNLGVFQPAFHGREHLNVATWMEDLKNGNEQAHLAFEHGVWGFKNKNTHNVRYQAAFDVANIAQLGIQAKIMADGLTLFEQLHGHKARFLVPPNGPFHRSLETVSSEHGVEYISTSKIQKEPLGFGKTATRYHYIGQRNAVGQIYITRNCFFEPSYKGRDWKGDCLNEISTAFYCLKPAIISTHRVNYIGSLNPQNRVQGLLQLAQLLQSIQQKWPDVEFLTSMQLGDIIAGKEMTK